jgi:putative transcriptional regulator
MGGPVDGPLIALHEEFHSKENSVCPGCFVSVGKESLNLLVSQTTAKFRVYSGYSGWGPKQLEQELEQGGWFTYPAAPQHVFDSPKGLWRQLCEQIGEDVLGRHVGKITPADSSMN